MSNDPTSLEKNDDELMMDEFHEIPEGVTFIGTVDQFLDALGAPPSPRRPMTEDEKRELEAQAELDML